MKAKKLGQAGLQGWRTKVADTVASPVARSFRASEDQVRSVIGAIFLFLTLAYLLQAAREIASER